MFIICTFIEFPICLLLPIPHYYFTTYGTRKIKVNLFDRNFNVSSCCIGRIMKEKGLVSTYTVAQYKPFKSSCNEAKTVNVLKRSLNRRKLNASSSVI
ncbi:IS3 family transposase [Paenibacillus sp. FSL A5-0031]|uniref:IS3 family transposase n=1 Tax=Paenibacillus sp. FSL A5-0031 TaxID=1920420 RepID=UPI003558FA8B